MAAAGVGEAAAETLLREKDALARAITNALYADMPELLERHGERGRSKCLEDMHYNLEHLAPAVALGQPAIFARYAEWLRDMLHSRGVGVDEVRRSLELTREVARASMSSAEADVVAESLDAALVVLGNGAATGAR